MGTATDFLTHVYVKDNLSSGTGLRAQTARGSDDVNGRNVVQGVALQQPTVWVVVTH